MFFMYSFSDGDSFRAHTNRQRRKMSSGKGLGPFIEKAKRVAAQKSKIGKIQLVSVSPSLERSVSRQGRVSLFARGSLLPPVESVFICVHSPGCARGAAGRCFSLFHIV